MGSIFRQLGVSRNRCWPWIPFKSEPQPRSISRRRVLIVSEPPEPSDVHGAHCTSDNPFFRVDVAVVRGQAIWGSCLLAPYSRTNQYLLIHTDPIRFCASSYKERASGRVGKYEGSKAENREAKSTRVSLVTRNFDTCTFTNGPELANEDFLSCNSRCMTLVPRR